MSLYRPLLILFFLNIVPASASGPEYSKMLTDLPSNYQGNFCVYRGFKVRVFNSNSDAEMPMVVRSTNARDLGLEIQEQGQFATMELSNSMIDEIYQKTSTTEQTTDPRIRFHYIEPISEAGPKLRSQLEEFGCHYQLEFLRSLENILD